jgi:hypothetical protein
MQPRVRITLPFAVTAQRAADPNFALELRVWDSAVLPLAVEKVHVRRRSDTPVAEAAFDWLKLMTIGPAGSWDKRYTTLQKSVRRLVAKIRLLLVQNGNSK